VKLWILRPVDGRDEWEPWYDKAFGFVVSAENEDEARRLADSSGGDETRKWDADESKHVHPWLDAQASTCEELAAHSSGVVMCDFHAA
jgi:hypothetical protein